MWLQHKWNILKCKLLCLCNLINLWQSHEQKCTHGRFVKTKHLQAVTILLLRFNRILSIQREEGVFAIISISEDLPNRKRVSANAYRQGSVRRCRFHCPLRTIRHTKEVVREAGLCSTICQCPIKTSYSDPGLTLRHPVRKGYRGILMHYKRERYAFRKRNENQ